jgi:hypothetical protein
VNEPREFKGYWWLPTSPKDTVYGTLVFSQRELRLDLEGTFSADPSIPPSTERTRLGRLADAVLRFLRIRSKKPAGVVLPLDMTPQDQPRIHGITNDHRRVTLDGCWGRSRSFSTAGYDITSYGADRILDGRWYDTDEQVRVDELWIRLSDLDSWADISGLGYTTHIDPAKNQMIGVDLKYTVPPSLDVDLGDGVTLKVAFNWGWSGAPHPMTETRITQGTTFQVCFPSATALDDALAFVPRF